jgi:lytic murein transglycosylase
MTLRAVALVLALLGAGLAAAGARAQSADDFRRFLDALWPDAEKAGVTRATFDKAFRGVAPDLALPDLVLPGRSEVKGQAEFTRTPAEYLNAAFLARLAAQGKGLQTRHAQWLAKIERELGVQRQFVLAIWGRETAFGAHRSSYYVIKALATQAFLGRRRDLFRNELIYALKMLEDGVRTRDNLTGSWAGAMGLTQFMPSEFYTMGHDLDGDGRLDIWNSVADALGSAARQLREKGWVPGQSWGYEVRLPKAISCALEGERNKRPLSDWVRLGVVRARGDFPSEALDQAAFILAPAGAHGPAFLALENFLVIKRYNMSDLYALFVGNLGDRIAGGGSFAMPWARVRQLSAQGIRAIQENLQTLGYEVSIVDGKAGMNTRALIGAYQRDNNARVDCWPSAAMLRHLSAKVAAREAGADASKKGSGPGPR